MRGITAIPPAYIESINQARTLVYRPDKNRRVGRVVLQPDLHQIAARQRTKRLIAALCQASL